MNSAPPSPSFHAVIVAGGSGTRAAQHVPKQFAKWRGKPVLTHSIAALADAGAAHIAVVVPDPADPLALDSIPDGAPVTLLRGGDTRQASVRAGLDALASHMPERVLIHDAARPDIPARVISRLLAALEDSAGAIPVLPVADSLIVANDAVMGDPVDRDTIRRVQTPQAFHFGTILSAHRSWSGPATAGDDAQVARAAGHAVVLVEGEEALKKLTYAADFEIEERSTMPMMRIGSGYDVHRLAEGEALWLAGIQIEHTHGLAGHSDADVALHAITDAVLGAIGAGDIGQHFSPSDARWAGASSDRFLRHARALADEAGYETGNVDVTIICEAPKIGPHRDAMRASIASILDIPADRVSVKGHDDRRTGADRQARRYRGASDGSVDEEGSTMTRTLSTKLAAAAAALSTAALPTTLSAQECVAQSDVADAVVFAVPIAVKTLRTKCGGTLSSDGFLMSGSDTMVAAFEQQATAAWPGALRLISTFAGKDGGADAIAESLATLDAENAGNLLGVLLPGMVMKDFDMQDCGKIERGLELLAPLPPENLGGIAAFLAEMSKVKNPSICSDDGA